MKFKTGVRVHFPAQGTAVLLRCYRYIELNPLRAAVVNNPEDYRRSSYGANGCARSDPLVLADEISALVRGFVG